MTDDFQEFKNSETTQSQVAKPKARSFFTIPSLAIVGAFILFVFGYQNSESTLIPKLDEEINLIQQTPIHRELTAAIGLWSASAVLPSNEERQAYIMPPPSDFQCKDHLIHIQTDKPVYKPSDLIFVQAFLVDPITKVPCKAKRGIFGQIEIRDGQDKLLSTLQNQSPINSGSFSFVLKVPKDVLGGKYQLIVRSGIQYFLPSRRQILINQYSQPEYFVSTDFDKAGANYLPGSLVKAKIKVRRPDNSPLMSGSFLKVNNDQTGLSLVQNLTSQGEGVIEFMIPADFQGSLFICSLVVMDGFSAPVSGSFATSLQVSVLNINNIYVKFFSPNTKRVSGLPCTIYFQAYAQDINQPEARIVPFEFENAQLQYSQKGQSGSLTTMPGLTDIKHIHNGRGKFMFIPKDNQTYQLKISIQSQAQFNQSVVFPVVIQTSNEFKMLSENKDFQFVSVTLAQTVINWNKNKTQINLQMFTKIPDSDTQLTQENNFGSYNVNLTIMNKNKNVFVFSQKINVSFWEKSNDYLQCNLSIPMNASNFSAAGGVHILQVNISAIQYNKSSQQTQQFLQEVLINQFEKLIFIRPSLNEIKNVSLKLEEQNYAPGDTVKMSLNFGDQLDQNEQIFTSVIVTDVSSYLQLQNHEQPPSLPSMVYLEKEVATLGGKTFDQSPLDQFLNSKDYVDSWFTHVESDLSNVDSQQKISQLESQQLKADANIDALLAIQDWRQGIFTDQKKYLKHTQNFYQENERLQNLIVQGSPILYERQMQPNGAHPIKRNMVPMMEKAAYQEDSMVPEQPQDSQTPKVISDTSVVKIQDASQDFMVGQHSLSREYSHSVRFGFSKTQPRIDFTQTLFYRASSESFDSLKFDLNDQVSTFVVTVTMVTSKGRYCVLNQYFKSQLMVFSSFNLPRSMLYGDSIKVPIQIYNNLESNLVVDYQIQERIITRQNQSIDPKMNWLENQKIEDKTQMISLLKTTKGKVNIVGNGYGQIWQSLDSRLIQEQWRNDGTELFMEISLKVLDKTDLVQDSVIKYTNVFFGGAPQTYSSNGIIEVNNVSLVNETTRIAFWTLSLPRSVSMVPRFSAKVFNSQLDSIIDSLRRLLQNPSGCFEQTSTTTYPQVMALSLLQEMEQSALQPELVTQIADLRGKFIGFLKDGYKRLLNFETNSKGYEWFGESPGHEALTAYGLMQFHDMKQIKAIDFIDRSAFDRNINWLLGRKSKTNPGQFMMNPKALDSFGRAGQEVTDAYIVWALSQSYSSLSKENSSAEIPWTQEDTYNNLQDQFNYLKQVAGQQDDPYIQALLTSALSNLNHTSEALVFAQRLSQKQDKSTGVISGSKTSITNSFGSSLDIETTSLAIIAWIQTNKGLFGDQIQLGVKYLTSINQNGQSGSTQATILSLKALALFKKYFGNFNGKGDFVLRLNQEVVQRIPFDSSNNKQSMDKIDFSQAINKKVQDIYLNNIDSQNEFAGITQKPLEFSIGIEKYEFNTTIPRVTSPLSVQFQISATYKNFDPVQELNPQLNHSLSFKVIKDPVSVPQSLGSQRKLSLTLINNGSQNEGMALVHLPLPACLQLTGGSGGLEQLELLKSQGLFNHYEMSSTELIIYWTYMKVNEKKQVDLIFIRVFQTDKDSECIESVARSYYYYSDQIINYQK